MHLARGIGHAERVPSAEAVARDADAGRARRGPQVGDGRLEQRLNDLGAVPRNEFRRVVAGVVEVRRCGRAVEEVWGDGEEAGAGEGVDETGEEESEGLHVR